MTKSRTMTIDRGAVVAAALTLVGVPAGLALTGGPTDPLLTDDGTNLVMSGSLAVVLALLSLFLRRWPLTVLITSVVIVAGMRGGDLITAGWVWPATAAPDGDRLAVLTAREREVVRLVAAGLSNEDIARELVISPLTAKTHITRAIAKIGVRDRVQLVMVAFEDGLVGRD